MMSNQLPNYQTKITASMTQNNMDKEKLWHEMFKPAMVKYLKAKKEQLESEGFIPTLEMLIEDLEK